MDMDCQDGKRFLLESSIFSGAIRILPPLLLLVRNYSKSVEAFNTQYSCQDALSAYPHKVCNDDRLSTECGSEVILSKPHLLTEDQE